jgi:hypothetical protein
MSIADAEMRPESKRTVKLVRVEVEVPEDAVEAVLAFASERRAAAGSAAKSFKEMLESAPGDDAFWDDVASARDKRPMRDIDL